jgi:hypothetical protein
MSRTNRRDVIVELQGGLGNQLFQYQFANFAQTISDKKVSLSVEKIEGSNLTHFGKDISSLNLILKIRELPRCLLSGFFYRIYHSLNVRSLIPSKFEIMDPSIYYSKEIGYDEELLSRFAKSNNLRVVNGYFQSWKYGVGRRSIMEELFDQMKIANTSLRTLESKFRSNDIAAVHIRLGDYKSTENAYIGILSPDYYKTCLKYINDTSGEKEIYVFSDEIGSARSIYSGVFPHNTTWVDPIGAHDPIEILKLMTLARTFILGNSTFGWWAAYMSNNLDYVLAPSKWFKSARDPKDLIPPNWIRIESDWIKT